MQRECQHLHGSNFEKADPLLHAADPTTPSPERFISYVCVSFESLTGDPGCSHGEPHGAPLHPHSQTSTRYQQHVVHYSKKAKHVLALYSICRKKHFQSTVHHATCHQSEAWLAITPSGAAIPHCRNSTLIYIWACSLV